MLGFGPLRLQKVMELLLLTLELFWRWRQSCRSWALAHIIWNETEIHVIFSERSFCKRRRQPASSSFNGTKWFFGLSRTYFWVKLESTNIKMFWGFNYILFWHFCLLIILFANVSKSWSGIGAKVLTNPRTQIFSITFIFNKSKTARLLSSRWYQRSFGFRQIFMVLLWTKIFLLMSIVIFIPSRLHFIFFKFFYLIMFILIMNSFQYFW